MKLGLIVRSEDRGLGSLSRDFYEHLDPDRVLVVIPTGVPRHGLISHLEWYPDATVVRYDGHLPEHTCRAWLEGLDAVWSAETFYDWRFCRWARDAHVATVCHLMPEWWRPQWAVEPTAWWAPTSWRLEHLPEGTRHVPIPIAIRAPRRRRRKPGPFRWLHVAGAQTEADRNGTGALLEAAQHLTDPQEIIIRSQSPGITSTSDRVTVITETVADRWQLYDEADALVMPRRYAGLSLPVLEAFAAGLPALMTDMSPQNVDWPVQIVPTAPSVPVRLFGHTIETTDADPVALAAIMDQWASDPAEVQRWSARVRHYATANSWETRIPEIHAELERVADLAPA